MLVEIFESIMLLCFGSAWPFSIYKIFKSKSSEGKSVLFSCIIITGYISGIFAKGLMDFSPIVFLYLLNVIMISVDLTLVVFFSYQKNINNVVSSEKSIETNTKKYPPLLSLGENST